MPDAEFTEPYEETLETIRQRMFDTLASLYPDPETRPDIREPQPAFTLLSTPAAELALFYEELNQQLRNSFVQFAETPYLDYRGEELGVTRLAPTVSTGTLRFMGDVGTIVPIGTTASTEAPNPDDPSYSFDTTDSGTIVGVTDPVVAPTPLLVGGYVQTAQAGGATANEVQLVTLMNASAGTFTMTYSGQTTAAIDWDATAVEVRDALVALSNIAGACEVQTITVNATNGDYTITCLGFTTAAIDHDATAGTVQTALETAGVTPGDVIVTGGPGDVGGTTPYTFTFRGGQAYTNVATMTTDPTNLTGVATATVATVTPGAVADVSVSGAAGGPWTITFENALALTDVAEITLTTSGLTGSAGNITGDVVYQFAYVSSLISEQPTRGLTLPSPESSALTAVSGESVVVLIPSTAYVASGDMADLIEITAVRIYRSYKPVSDVDFGDFKLVGEVSTNPTMSNAFLDNVSDAEFLLLDPDEDAEVAIPDVNTTGVVDVAGVSQDTGEATSVAAGTVSILQDDTPGVEVVTNSTDFSGGSDEEDTEVYRERILEFIQASGGAGNVADYAIWAKSIDGIYGVSVSPEWDGPGTVKVVVSGPNNEAIADADKIEEVRQYIAGTKAIADPTTVGTMAATPSNGAGALDDDTYYYAVTFMNSSGGETVISPLVSAVVAGAHDTVTLSDIPLGPTGVTGPELCTQRRLYRRKGVAGDWHLLTLMEDNSTTGYTDVTVEASLPAPSTPGAATLTGRTIPAGNSTSLYDGVAPLGSHVTVQTVVPLAVYVTADIVPQTGYSIAGSSGTVDLSALLYLSLDAYVKTLEPGQNVKYIDVMNAIHDTPGVDDFANVLINGVASSLAVPDTDACEFSSGPSVFTEVTSV